MSDSGVAVVITCFELGRTLPDTLESAITQTAAPREVIVVDDGSTDAVTRQALDALEQTHGQVRVIRASHGGVARARNVGVEATTAPLVLLLDADDVLEPTYLEKAAALLSEREDLSFVCCALQAFEGATYRWKPPPYTIGEALGRGACGHISTVFRREVWERVGGFDEALPAYEDADFWLRALLAGLSGVILDEALVRYRVRRDSRYHLTIVSGEYDRAKRLLFDKHRTVAEERSEDILVTLLDFERELREHGCGLRDEEEELARDLAAAEAEVESACERLRERGLPRFDWGRAATAPAGEADVERRLRLRALADLGADRETPRELVVRAGEAPPEPGDARHDRIVLDGSLERAPDPAAALAACHGLLRPGGELIVLAGTIAALEGRAYGLTEGAVRELLCDLFPPAHVRVASYGNLMTTLAVAGQAAAETLSSAELELDDPAFPTLIGAVARIPRRSRLRLPGRAGPPPMPPPRARPVARHGAVLCYHRVASHDPDVHRLCMPPEVFARQMEIVAREHTPVSLVQLAARVREGRPTAGMVAVTFDDGYHDNFARASPILEELGVPATFFMSGAPTAEPREAWWDTLERVLVGIEQVPERLVLSAEGIAVDLPTGTRDARRDALRALHGRLLSATADQIEAVREEVAAWSAAELPVRETHRLMTAGELAELASRPAHAVGAHGVDHLLLTAHPAAVRWAELGASKDALEEVLGEPVTALAYAYGGCDLDTVDIAGELGFDVACTVEHDAVTLHSDPLRMPRIEIRDESPEALAGLLTRAMGPLA